MRNLFELAEMADYLSLRQSGVFRFEGIEFELKEAGHRMHVVCHERFKARYVDNVLEMVEFINHIINNYESR